MAEKPNPPNRQPRSASAAATAPVQIPVDIEHMVSTYANFFRVTGTPEELVLDFGLNTQQVTPAGTPEPVRLTQRLTIRPSLHGQTAAERFAMGRQPLRGQLRRAGD